MGCRSGVQGWPLRSGRRWSVEVTPARWTPPPRDKGGTHPGRISLVWNVETPLGSGRAPGRLTVREAQFPSGKGRPEKLCRRPKGSRKPRPGKRHLPSLVSHNWPDTAYAEPERVLTRVG